MKKKELREEFASLCWGISKVNNEWHFWWELIEGNENYNIYKNKMNNLLKLLNENEIDIINRDIEDEIYDMI